MMRKRLLRVMPGFLLLGLCSCGVQNTTTITTKQTSSDPKTKIAFVSNNAEEFWTIAEAGTRKAAAEFNVDVLFRRPGNGTAEQQKEIIEDLLTQKVQGMAISVNDPKNQVELLNEVAARMPLVTQDNDAPQSKRLCYIGTNNYDAGLAAGKLVKECMPNGGHVAIFVGKPDPLNARERRQGVLDALAGEKDAKGPKEYGKYTLLDTFYDDVDQSVAKDKAAAALVQLQGKPDICMVGLWAYNPPVILGAVQDAGKVGKVHIVGFDEMTETLKGIRNGSIYGTIVQQPFEFGYQSVKLLNALAKGHRSVLPDNGILYVPHLVIKKDNVDEFQTKLNALLGKK